MSGVAIDPDALAVTGAAGGARIIAAGARSGPITRAAC